MEEADVDVEAFMVGGEGTSKVLYSVVQRDSSEIQFL